MTRNLPGASGVVAHMNRTQLANESWEALFRAQVALNAMFAGDDVWLEVTQVEYDVLYTLSKASDGMSMTELNRGILMTQGGLSKLVTRLEGRGLILRTPDPQDRRATCLALTQEGRAVQRKVGLRHGAAVTAMMTRLLDEQQMEALRAIGTHIVTALDAAPVTRPAASGDHVGAQPQK